MQMLGGGREGDRESGGGRGPGRKDRHSEDLDDIGMSDITEELCLCAAPPDDLRVEVDGEE
jgi:hypothetical protein